MSFSRLIRKIDALDNPTVVGLDPRYGKLPGFIREKAVAQYGKTLEAAAEASLEFNKGLIDALCGVVPAVKPQSAFYEQFGWQGMRALKETVDYAKSKGMFVIADAKRGDIGSTMEAYADAFLGKTDIEGCGFEPFGADALTVNGYLGSDGVAPALKACEKYDKGLFVLVKTSNPSSCEMQDIIAEGGPVYERMGALCEDWGNAQSGYSSVGAVVGATFPEQLGLLRAKLPHTFFLVPGYGAQGGGAADAAPAFDKDGGGAVVNASRSIIFAYLKEGCDERDYAGAALREAVRMRDALNSSGRRRR
jgi:orotidine-5'-phosphate decarboxylase